MEEFGINSIIDIQIITLKEKLRQNEINSPIFLIFKKTSKDPNIVERPARVDITIGNIIFIIKYYSN
jgi:hypothetical protein